MPPCLIPLWSRAILSLAETITHNLTLQNILSNPPRRGATKAKFQQAAALAFQSTPPTQGSDRNMVGNFTLRSTTC